MELTEQLRIFGEAAVSIFAIVNPFVGLPIFVSLTEDFPARDQRRVLRLAGWLPWPSSASWRWRGSS